MSLTAVQYGVGPIGQRIVEVAATRGITFVGAVDVDPAKVGQDLGAVAGLDPLGVEITDDPQAALAAEPDVVFHATVSDVTAIGPQIEPALAAGADVISTTEELAYPWLDHGPAAAELDEMARRHGQTVLGTGINPGFAMDTLPAVLTTPCQRVDAVSVTRVQDASQRRGPLQEKIGAGLSRGDWEAEIAPEAGHVGLPESIAMLAAALGWDLTDVEETIEPVIAESAVESEFVTAQPDDVAGLHQVGTGYVDGEPAIELDLSMYLGAPEPRDEIEIEGRPDLSVTVDGGFHGDVTTPAVAVNAVERVREGDPGLATMIDLATPRYTAVGEP